MKHFTEASFPTNISTSSCARGLFLLINKDLKTAPVFLIFGDKDSFFENTCLLIGKKDLKCVLIKDCALKPLKQLNWGKVHQSKIIWGFLLSLSYWEQPPWKQVPQIIRMQKMQDKGHEDFSSTLGKESVCWLFIYGTSFFCHFFISKTAINVSSFNIPSLIRSWQCLPWRLSVVLRFFCHQLPEIKSLASFIILHLYFWASLELGLLNISLSQWDSISVFTQTKLQVSFCLLCLLYQDTLTQYHFLPLAKF